MNRLIDEHSSSFDNLIFLGDFNVSTNHNSKLWKRKTDWDELLPLNLTKSWQKWLENLPDIQNFTLDRWYGSTNTDTKLHVFVDGSKIAYGAPCYIRFKTNN